MKRLLVALFFIAASAHAAVIEVEGPQDSLDGPPLINHCTLRKAAAQAACTAAFVIGDGPVIGPKQ